MEKHQIEAATPHHKLEITIAVLEHLENHNELTKIPINMHKMNHWMKRYPILAEKIELGIDLDKFGKVWVSRKCIQKIRELLKQLSTKSSNKAQQKKQKKKANKKTIKPR